MAITLPLTNSQVLILKTLARNANGLTREEIAEKSGVVVDNTTLGPVYSETCANHPESLVALRLVRVEKISPDAPTMYKLTPGGENAAKAYSARKRGTPDKVDPKTLDKVVLRIKPLKPYGIENFTDDDLKQVRAELPEEDREVTIPSLRNQILNRRKQGAYKEETWIEPEWYKEYRESREFKTFEAKVMDFYSGCAICENLEATVYHRRFTVDGSSILCVERAKDGIALCTKCHTRNCRFICQIPDTQPE